MFKNLKFLLISLYKMAVILIVSLLFFFVFSRAYTSLTALSRTLFVTIFSFSLSLALFSKIYGIIQIGELKSKPIIYTSTLSVFFTDIITYLSLMVMITNPNNAAANPKFALDNLSLLLIVFIAQVIFLIFASYLGNYIYFSLFEPLKTVIITDNDCAKTKKLERYLERFAKQYNITGVVDVRDDGLDDILNDTDLVIFGDIDNDVRKNLIEVCYLLNIDFIYLPTVSDVVELSGQNLTYDDIPVVEVKVGGLNFNQRFFKRALDLTVSLIGVLITMPIWLIIFIAIKLDDRGPVFFKQKRKTIDNKDFEVFKFRTMKVGAVNYSATENDDRITRVGSVLRKIRMDELPQLLNIVRGEMSLVGPRPEMLSNVSAYEDELPEFRYRLKVKGGLTGIAQIEGKYNTSPKDKLIMDLTYIENYSIWLDIKLMFRTMIIFFKKDSVEGFEEDL